MSSTTTSLINCSFGGIRRKDAVFMADKITCSDCQNVELFFTKLNSGIGIRTSKGNQAITTCIPSGEKVIGIFESMQDGNVTTFVYTETSTVGRLYTVDLANNTCTRYVNGMNVTGNACGCDFTQGILDMFIFSNGKDVKYLYSNTETHAGITVESASNIHLIDPEGNAVSGLGLCVFDSRLWIFNGNTVWYSKQAECRDFQYQDSSIVTSAGFIPFVKPVTAIYPYLGALAVFHKDSSSLVQIDATTAYRVDDESPGGCAGYNSLVFHGTDLYFYDDTKKGVFSFQQVINGDKTLGDNIAFDIQDELYAISKYKLNQIKALSVITADRNEVWFLVPIEDTYTVQEESDGELVDVEKDASIILIYDYVRSEWVKRKSQLINTIQVVDSKLYSANDQILQEYVGNTFNGDFIENFYTCSTFNFGEDNTLKITKFPPRLSVDSSYSNKFWVKYVKNYDLRKKPKTKEIKGKSQADVLIFNSGDKWNGGKFYKQKGTTLIVKIPSATFKALEITFYTDKSSQNFCIKNMEFSKIKVKQV